MFSQVRNDARVASILNLASHNACICSKTNEKKKEIQVIQIRIENKKSPKNIQERNGNFLANGSGKTECYC